MDALYQLSYRGTVLLPSFLRCEIGSFSDRSAISNRARAENCQDSFLDGAGGRTRTYDGGTPADLQSAVIATRRLQRLAINNTIGVFIHYNKVCKTLQGLL